MISSLTGLFLSLVGFSKQQIGIVLGLSILIRIFGPYLFLFLSKFSRSLVTICIIQCILLFIVLLIGISYPSTLMIIISLCLVNLIWISILPNLETISLTHIKGDMKRYSTIRMWGSIGFIAFSLWASEAMIKLGPNIYWLILLMLSILLIGSVVSLLKFGKFEIEKGKDGEEGKIFHIEKKLLPYYVVFLLFEMTHAPYYGFFSIKMIEFGYSGLMVGSLIAFAVVCEIVTFGKGHALFKYLNVNYLLIICSISGILRWFLVEYFMGNVYLLLISQLLHAFTFALYHICTMSILSQNANQALIGKRQTTYTAITMGIGAALGSYLSGALWDLEFFEFSSFISVGVATSILATVTLGFIIFGDISKKNKHSKGLA